MTIPAIIREPDGTWSIRVLDDRSGIIGPRLRKGDPTSYPPHTAPHFDTILEHHTLWVTWLQNQHQRLNKSRKGRKRR